MDPELIPPYGGVLVDPLAEPTELDEAKAYASRLPSLQLSERALCDLEIMASGGFSPLDRFMGQEDYERVLEEMKLASGHIFPIPITLPVQANPAIALDRDIALRDRKNELLAIMTIEELYEWDRRAMADRVFQTQDIRHPLVAEMQSWGQFHISGRLRVLQLPRHYDFAQLRLTPRQTRARLAALDSPNVVAFQTRNPLHRSHEELTKRAIEEVDGVLLLHPVVGMAKPGDVDHFTRVRTYKTLVERYYDPQRVVLALLPLAMRLAGPREALWHALIRRNYGANHIIVGRDHASPGTDSTGKPFYGRYDAQELVARYQDELGVRMLASEELVYVSDEMRYEQVSKVEANLSVRSISGTQLRDQYLSQGKPLPDWFTRPEVADILVNAYPPQHKRGVCIWFTGLSGAGKSTTAELLTVLLQERGRQVTLLDGDVVRTHLSKGLSFSREDRDANVRRIGFVASEVVRHGGISICAAVSPYRAARVDVRNMVGDGHFVEVFVDTPLEVCEQRDFKGLYAKARRGELAGFTGVDDPYEAPVAAEVVLDTVNFSPADNAEHVLQYLLAKGFVSDV